MIFLDKYNNKKNIRFNSFKKTLDICNLRDCKIIVETGTSRGKNRFFFFNTFNWKDGMSTPMFAEYANFINGELHSCDIDINNIKISKKFTKKYSNHVYYYNLDSVLFLKNFPKKIDLLYLDSLDGHNIKNASIHQLNEIKNSINKLHNNSLILLDDKGTKTNLSISFIKQFGFKIIFETKYQVLFSK
tara:strand:- start:279 stop:842 length:564 start_codon:yes stop_codon:yes gene_type:complete